MSLLPAPPVSLQRSSSASARRNLPGSFPASATKRCLQARLQPRGETGPGPALPGPARCEAAGRRRGKEGRREADGPCEARAPSRPGRGSSAPSQPHRGAPARSGPVAASPRGACGGKCWEMHPPPSASAYGRRDFSVMPVNGLTVPFPHRCTSCPPSKVCGKAKW